MWLMDAVQVWKIETGKEIPDYFRDIHLDERLDRDTLINFIFMEFGQLDTVDSDTFLFKSRMEYFFLIHEYNIKKLLDTMYYDYNPLTNVDMKYERKAHYDQFDDENTKNTRDLRNTFWENLVEDEETDTTRNIDSTDNITANENITGHKTGSASNSETDMHFVSAFNRFGTIGNPEDINQFGDVEKSRDTIRATGTSSEDSTQTKDNSSHEIGTENTNEGIDRDREYTKTHEDIDDEEKTGLRTNDMDRDEKEERTEFGNNGRYAYQELIKEERSLAEINIYKWIIKHMAKELFVCVY